MIQLSVMNMHFFYNLNIFQKIMIYFYLMYKNPHLFPFLHFLNNMVNVNININLLKLFLKVSLFIH